MSYPTSLITCEKCQKTYSGDFAWGKYIYEFTCGTQLDLNRQLGWCDDCWSVVEMEDLSTSELSKRIESMRNDWRAHRRGLSRFLPKNRQAAAEVLKKISELEKNLIYLERRSSPAKCLRCGSPHVSSLPHLNWPSKSGIYVRNTWTHPGCGGTMLTHGDDTHYSDLSPLVVYNQDGILIREVDRGW